MVENRPVASVLSHLVLVLGVLIVAFPIYLTFIASTHTAQEIVQQVPMSLLPGDNTGRELQLALFGGQTDDGGAHAAGGADDVGQPGHARWSSPSARSPSRCCRPSRSCTSASRCATSSSG